MTSDDSEDDRTDENLSILREALHHFALGIDTPSDSDEEESNEELLTDEEQCDESVEDEEEDRSAGLAVLRETLFALCDTLTDPSDGDGDEDGPAP